LRTCRSGVRVQRIQLRVPRAVQQRERLANLIWTKGALKLQLVHCCVTNRQDGIVQRAAASRPGRKLSDDHSYSGPLPLGPHDERGAHRPIAMLISCRTEKAGSWKVAMDLGYERSNGTLDLANKPCRCGENKMD